MADQPTDVSNKPAFNVPRMAALTEMSPVPPGMGELNYIQMLLAGLIDQTLYTTSSPTFAGLIVSGLTASLLVGTSATKALQSISVGTSLSLSGTTLNAIQGIRTADSPSFTGLTIGSLAGILKAAAGVVAAATIGSSLSYSAPTLDAIQDIRTSASPTFTGLNLTSSAWTKALLTTTSVTALVRLGSDLQGLNFATNALWTGSVWSRDDTSKPSFALIQHMGNTQYEFRIAAATTGNITWLTPLKITDAGLVNITGTGSLGIPNPAQTFYMRFTCGSALLADRILTITPGDAARTITLSGNPTLADWFDQAVKAASTPSFASLKLTTTPSVGHVWACSNVDGSGGWAAASGGMVYPGTGIPISTSAAWGTSLALDEQQLLGRITGGIMAGLTSGQVRTLLGLATADSPVFVTAKLSGLTDGYIPYHVDDATGLANGPTKTDVDSAVSLKHAAVTVSAPISLSTQALSLVNDAAATVTEIDTGVVADSDTVVPTSKAVKTAIAAAGGGLPMGYATGLEATNAAEATHDITVAVGKMRDTTNTYDLALTSAMTKQIDAAWAAGTNQGGMFTGAVGNSTLYYRILIRKDSDGTIDWGFDTSATAANIPAGYTAYAVMGYELTNGSANILASNEITRGNTVTKWFNANISVATGLTQTSYTAQSLSAVIPTGLTQVEAMFRGTADDQYGLTLSSDGTNESLLVSLYTSIGITSNTVRGEAGASFIPIISNQIYYKVNAGTAAAFIAGVRFKR